MTEPKKVKPRARCRKAGGPRYYVGVKFTEPTQTKQSFKNDCDINRIMARFQKTGAITHVQNHSLQYGFASGATFTESMNIVANAQSMFNELPSSIRTKFKNDPAEFLDFVQNAANADELVELGLATRALPQRLRSEDRPLDDDSGASKTKPEASTAEKAAKPASTE